MTPPIAWAVSASVARPWRTLVVALILAALALLVAIARFQMTTDTAALISPDLGWRQQERAMEAAFSQLSDSMLVVIDGQTPELAEDGAATLTARLAADKAHFRHVSRPDGGEFFAREGLLFGNLADVKQTTAALIEAQPLLGPLASDPGLRGVSSAVGTMLDGVTAKRTSLAPLETPMRALADAAESARAGRPVFFSWQRLFAGGTGALSPPTRRLLLVQPALDHGALMPGAAASDAIATAANALALDPAHGVTLRLTGEIPLADEEFATLRENIGAVAAVMLGAMLVTLWFATRSAKLVAAIIATIAIGLVMTTAVGLLAVGRLNLISVAFIPLFVGLGVDFGIQLAVRFNAERARGLAGGEALQAAAAALGAPLGLAASAVFLGFGAFLPTAYIGIAELGVIAGLGMVIALALSVTLLPALIVLLSPGAPMRDVGFVALAPADRWLARHRRGVLWTFAAAMGLSVALLPLVQFDFNPLHLRDPMGPAMRALADLTRDPDRTPNSIDALAPDLPHARALAARLSRLREVRQVAMLDSFVPADQPAKLAAIQDAALLLDTTLNPFDLAASASDADRIAALRAAADKLRAVAGTASDPASTQARRLAAAWEGLAAAPATARARADVALAKPLSVMLASTRAALSAGPINRTSLPPDLARDWLAPDGQSRVAIFPAGDANDNRVLRRFRDAVERVTPAISGLPVATQAAGATVAGAFVEAGVIALLLVSALLYVALRNVREVAFTLAPVVLSIFLTLASCVAIGQPINFANIIAFPLLFGVGVAFHIYFVMAWRGGATDLLQSSLARAILFSALATGTAFGSLWLSHHPGTASMGKILLISLAWTLVCALIFEPALLGPPRPAQASAA